MRILKTGDDDVTSLYIIKVALLCMKRSQQLTALNGSDLKKTSNQTKDLAKEHLLNICYVLGIVLNSKNTNKTVALGGFR